MTDNCWHFLSVVHVTGDSMNLIKPDQVTDSHVIINVQGFSCFGLVTAVTCRAVIHGLVLLFSKLSEHSLFVLLLPRNVCLAQVGRPLPHAEGLPSPMNTSDFYFYSWDFKLLNVFRYGYQSYSIWLSRD